MQPPHNAVSLEPSEPQSRLPLGHSLRILTLHAYRALLTASLSAFPALNDGAFEVGMEIFAPFVLFDVEY